MDHRKSVNRIGYLEQIHAPAEYLEQVNVLQESVSDLTIQNKRFETVPVSAVKAIS